MPQMRAKTYFFGHFSENYMKVKEIELRGVHASLVSPLDPPL